MQEMVDHHTRQQHPIQKKENTTGLPDQLKSGVERLSGYTMDDVTVHYNSPRPAQLQAHAYAQGTDIHLASGQEKHLPHEAWHVVQQKQGRVAPTLQLKGKVAVNDDPGLEQEADVMGSKALQHHAVDTAKEQLPVGTTGDVAQLVRIEHKGINGLTHLVEMTEGGNIYNGEDWLKNEREEVRSGDLLTVDLDDGWYSHRGINQEVNWKRDGGGKQDHLWVKAVTLNHKPLKKGTYVRAEMLNDGLEDIPKTMHSIWIQGDYRSNEEAQVGMATRQDMRKDGWVNMMWLYDSMKESKSFDSGLLEQSLDLEVDPFRGVFERSFVDEMNTWKKQGTMPKWVERWLPILDILKAKKSYITMSDIMRMIVLYYEGGVYMDVKIKVNPGKSDFKTRPMLLVNTANFYARENWAIMANAGCQIIEEIMIQALKQFPNVEQLSKYPENYQGEKGVEGKRHVELHERLGVWNVIERFGRNEYSETLSLTNPRPLNSWADPYEDREPEVVRREKEQHIQNEIDKVERLLTEKNRKLKQLKEQQEFAVILKVTEKELKEIPGKIRTLGNEIFELDMELYGLKESLHPVEKQGNNHDDKRDDEDGENDEEDELMKRLAALKNL